MSKAAELLKSLAPVQTEEDLTTLVIDNRLRTIMIPKGITNLGVENDDDVLQLHFKMPRYLGTTDLSEFTIRVNYCNANGEGDANTVPSPTIGYDTIQFDWLVGPNATKYKGNVKFIVCAIKFDAEGYVAKEYNTTIASLPVLEGLETNSNAVSRYSDVLEQWRRDLFGIGDTEEASIRSVGESERQNVERKGAEVLATIPEDYKTTYKMANDAYRTRANAIVSTVQGESIVVTDSSNDPLRGLRVFGKTTQVTTTGKNLAWTNINMADAPYLGVTCSATADGNIRLTGISTSSMWNRLASANLVAGKTYTLSCNKIVSLSIWDVTGNAAFGVKHAGSTSITFVAPNTGSYSLFIENVADVTFSSILADIMLNEGDATLPWEPYSNGLASPVPEWPQELTSITEPTMYIASKNLFPVTTMTAAGVTLSAYKDYFVLNGTAESSYNFITRIGYLPAGKYTLSANNPVHNSVNYAICDIYSDQTKQVLAAFDNKINSKISGAYNEASDWVARIRIEKGVSYNNYVVKPQLEVGSVESKYVPYAPNQTITLPYTLAAVPVTQNGNYTDANGQQWVCDEIDFERGVYVQRVGLATMNEDVYTEYILSAKTGRGQLVVAPNPPKDQSAYGTLCNIATRNVEALQAVDGQYYENPANIVFVGAVGEVEASIREKCQSLELLYVLATPIEAKLTAEEIETFKAIHTNYPGTTVLSNADATMELVYNVDTKAYIDSHGVSEEQVNTAVAKYLTDNPVSGETMVDSVTGKSYKLAVVNGKLTLASL